MNHYEILGVSADATAEEIETAYRRAASRTHPDKDGGTDAAFKQVQRAGAVLRDPEARKRYDETGNDVEGPTVESEARNMLAQMFKQALDMDGDSVSAVRQMLGGLRTQGTDRRMTLQATLKRLTKRSGKITVANGVNLAQNIIDQCIDDTKVTIVAIEKGLAAVDLAIDMAKQYSEEVEPPQHTSAGLSGLMTDRFNRQSFGDAWR
jgi:curved DNA-binding protein CbpA